MNEEPRTRSESPDEEILRIDIAKLIQQLKLGWKRIATWGGIAVLIGIIIALSIPKEYEAVAELSPELTSNSSSAKLSSITNMLGISGAVNSNDALHPTIYPKMVRATPFLVGLLQSEVVMEEESILYPMTLREYMAHHTHRTWWKAATLGIKKTFRKKSDGVTHDSIDCYHLTAAENALVQRLSTMIAVNVDKKTSTIKITTQAQNAHVAADLCRTVTRQLQQNVTNYRTDKAKRNQEYYEGLYEDVKAEYYRAQNAYAHYVDGHQGLILLSVKAEQDRLMNEMNLKYQLYNNVASELQNAKAKVQLEAPVFAEIVPPTVPLKPVKPKRKLLVFIFCFLGVCAGSGDVLLRAKLAEMRETQA